LQTPLGDLPLNGRLRGLLAAADTPRKLILGIRPEHFEDARLVEGDGGHTFTAPVDLVESMGSDKYVYLNVDTAVSSSDLEDLAADAGGADLPEQNGLVTRLSAESRVREGAEARVWLNTDKIHLFDPATGRNLTLEQEVPAT